MLSLEVWLYAIGSVVLVSVISLIGILTFGIQPERLKGMLIYMISFAAGALLGDAFFHLLPEIVNKNGFTTQISLAVLFGIGFSFFVEKVIHWRHCHLPITPHHHHAVALMNLFGDAVHNFIDGLVIAASYLAGIQVGIATTIAVILHEIPQEIADFGVLVHGGFSRGKALWVNFLTALTAVIGTVVGLWLGTSSGNLTAVLVPFAAGGFIYIAGSDLIPELHKEPALKSSMLQLAMFFLGILVMIGLLRIG
ncbi:ZIP family metal transporter [Candidatus Woesearchaeota archaeon]|nr:ZIP family metal transporter [Candidatus Woesearchaeota archaeon]